ncbi:MAG TPA: PD-(D/E)XK nuclease family protein [Coleofasciculaceae cyanobacterium]|jgi:CRISPR/Cas system-associated exonuclease Cas4 (RecB family)
MTKPAKKRFKSYAWVTWLAPLLAGEKMCKYAVWLPTQYQFEKPPSNYDSSEHDEMVIQRASQLQSEGFTVYVEYANSLKVNGKIFDICVAGRPDIVAIKDSWVVVEDCKTGKRRDSHRFQVLLYMLLLPLAPETKDYCQGHTPHGRLVYPDGTVEIPAWNVDRPFKQLLRQTIATICSATPPNPTPSNWECRYCTIPATHCPTHSSQVSNLQRSS